MDPSPVQPRHTSSQTHDVPIKTEERARPIPALPQQQQQQQPPPPPPPPQQRVQRYKDKFQALRERYENVISTHAEHTRAVLRATEKERHLQAEINMLLDAALAQSQSQSQSQSIISTPIPPATTTAPQSTTTTRTTPTPTPPVHAQQLLSPLVESHAATAVSAGSGPPPAHTHMNGHSTTVVAPPHAHAHAHAHGHGYAANHALPSAPAPSSNNDRAADPPLI